MDVSFFPRQQLQFIRQFYFNSVGSFLTTKQKIENEEEPFVPPYREDGDPPFELEWQEAEDSLQVLGITCVSMLSNSLKLYFTTMDHLHRFQPLPAFKLEFKNGFIRGYAAFYKAELSIDFEKAPCNLTQLEEIVLVRNAFEHPSAIYSHRLSHPAVWKESTSKFFCHDYEIKAWDMKDKETAWLCLPPAVHVDGPRLTEALDQADQFCTWLEEQLTAWQYPSRLKARVDLKSSH